MKERPILFSAPMVQALLAGKKTQTRREVSEKCRIGYPHDEVLSASKEGFKTCSLEFGWNCPYGRPGDMLWVRETWSTDFKDHYPCERVWYAADDDRKNKIHVRDGVRGLYSPESRVFVPFKWRPSIFMPRAASRILLEIVSVRVERLNEISESDAIAEGLHTFQSGQMSYFHWRKNAAQETHFLQPEMAYRDLWNSLNGPYAWDLNPWVWVVEFKKI